uniref:Methyltransferase like 27 n=1 Tax=Vombatus ursinus TaxID=29139 RepID=A0A4X2K516_VOMUR
MEAIPSKESPPRFELLEESPNRCKSVRARWVQSQKASQRWGIDKQSVDGAAWQKRGWSPRPEGGSLRWECTSFSPCLAVGCLASALPSPPQESLLLDVAGATAWVAVEVGGFCTLHGVEGSQSMLELAKRQGLCQQLSLCILGPEALPAPSDHYDAVMVVGTLSDGQVPYSAVPLHPSLLSGGLVCLTTRVNSSNLPYAELARLEQAGEWKQILVHTEDWWKWVTSEKEATGSVSSNCGFIPGVIYLYYKQEATPANAIGV